jgi:multiple sugar transport system permease protein
MLSKRSFFGRESVQAFFLIAPNSLGLILFYIVPIITSIVLAFFQWDGLSAPTWAGLGNFVQLTKDRLFINSFVNTLTYTVVVVPLLTVLVVLLGVLLSRDFTKFDKYFRTLFFLPLMTIPVVAALTWKWLLNQEYGLLNGILKAVGLHTIPWLSNPHYILSSIAIIGLWLGIAYNLIVIIAGIKGIPASYYEAAQLDGASPIHCFFGITVPLLTPSIFFVVVTQLIACFQLFDPAFVILGSDPPGTLKNAANTIVMSIYENGFTYFKMGYSSAQAFVLFIVILIITAIQFWGQKKWVNYD